MRGRRDAGADDRARIFQKIESIFGERPRSYIGADNKITSRWQRCRVRFDAHDPVVQMQPLVRAIGRAEARIAEALGAFADRLTIDAPQAELPPEGTGPSHCPGWIGGAFDGTVRVLHRQK